MSKLENFTRSLENLKDIYAYQEPYGNVELAGMVALYEICFAQAWKAMQEVLTKSGYGEGKTGSPKLIIKTAYAADMIQDESLWLQALADRNNVTHTYNEAIARGIIRNARDHYFEMFQTLRGTLERDWL